MDNVDTEDIATRINQLADKVGRVRNHVGTRPGAARFAIGRPSQVPTDDGIEDQRVIMEIVSNVACRRTPKAC